MHCFRHGRFWCGALTPVWGFLCSNWSLSCVCNVSILACCLEYLLVHAGSLCCCLLLVRRFSFWLVPACCMFLKCCSPYWPLLYWVTFLGFFSICTLDFDFVFLSFVFRLRLWCWCLVGLVALFIFISFAGGGLWPLALSLTPLFWILVVP